jgi:hypothetical protein
MFLQTEHRESNNSIFTVWLKLSKARTTRFYSKATRGQHEQCQHPTPTQCADECAAQAPTVASARVVTGIQIKTQDFVEFFGLLLILKTSDLEK